MSRYGYLEVCQRVPLDFEITRVDCICTATQYTCVATLENISYDMYVKRGSVQPAHACSLVRLFAERSLAGQGSTKISSNVEPCTFANAQVDINLRWAHMSKGIFSHVPNPTYHILVFIYF